MSFDDINPGDSVKAQILEISNEIGLKVVLGFWQGEVEQDQCSCSHCLSKT